MDELQRMKPEERERILERLEGLRRSLSSVREAAEDEEPMFDPREPS